MNRSPKRPTQSKKVGSPKPKKVWVAKAKIPTRSPTPKSKKPFYRDVATILADYYKPRYKLRSWVPKDQLEMTRDLVKNPKAIYFLKDYLESVYIGPNGKIVKEPELKIPYSKRISFIDLAVNPELTVLLEDHPEIWGYMELPYLAQNLSPDIVDLVVKSLPSIPREKQKYIINQLYRNPNTFGKMPKPRNESEEFYLYLNPKAGDLLYEKYLEDPYVIKDEYTCANFWLAICSKKHTSKTIEAEYKTNRKSGYLDWRKISENPSLIKLIKAELGQLNTQIRWNHLNYNENAVDILEKNPDKIDYGNLAFNLNSKAVAMCIKKYRETLDEDILPGLSKNPYAIEFLEKNPNLADISFLSANPAIFVEDRPDESTIKFFEDLKV